MPPSKQLVTHLRPPPTTNHRCLCTTGASSNGVSVSSGAASTGTSLSAGTYKLCYTTTAGTANTDFVETPNTLVVLAATVTSLTIFNADPPAVVAGAEALWDVAGVPDGDFVALVPISNVNCDSKITPPRPAATQNRATFPYPFIPPFPGAQATKGVVAGGQVVLGPGLTQHTSHRVQPPLPAPAPCHPSPPRKHLVNTTI